jgi:hypothetical protein
VPSCAMNSLASARLRTCMHWRRVSLSSTRCGARAWPTTHRPCWPSLPRTRRGGGRLRWRLCAKLWRTRGVVTGFFFSPSAALLDVPGPLRVRGSRDPIFTAMVVMRWVLPRAWRDAACGGTVQASLPASCAQAGERAAVVRILQIVGWQLPCVTTPDGWQRGRLGLRHPCPACPPACQRGGGRPAVWVLCARPWRGGGADVQAGGGTSAAGSGGSAAAGGGGRAAGAAGGHGGGGSGAGPRVACCGGCRC